MYRQQSTTAQKSNKIVNVSSSEKINRQSLLPTLNMEEIMKENPIGFYLIRKEIPLIVANEKNPLKLNFR